MPRSSHFLLAKKFAVSVPERYCHATQLDFFKGMYGPELSFCHPALTDNNFAKATTVLAPGCGMEVKIFLITRPVSSGQCLRFLRRHHAVLAGAQGASLVYQEGKHHLVKDLAYVSFDTKKALFVANHCHWVPYIRIAQDGNDLDVGYFEYGWGRGFCLLCFSMIPRDTDA